MRIVNIILPILLGYFLKSVQFVIDFLVLAINQLIYHILLLVLIFWVISLSPFYENFNGWMIAASYISMGIFLYSSKEQVCRFNFIRYNSLLSWAILFVYCQISLY